MEEAEETLLTNNRKRAMLEGGRLSKAIQGNISISKSIDEVRRESFILQQLSIE